MSKATSEIVEARAVDGIEEIAEKHLRILLKEREDYQEKCKGACVRENEIYYRRMVEALDERIQKYILSLRGKN